MPLKKRYHPASENYFMFARHGYTWCSDLYPGWRDGRLVVSMWFSERRPGNDRIYGIEIHATQDITSAQAREISAALALARIAAYRWVERGEAGDGS